MTEHKHRRLSIDLSPIQVVWLQTQLIFQKIEDELNNPHYSVQFYKLNDGIKIRVYGLNHSDCSEGMTRASEELSKVVSSNTIKLLDTTLLKDDYIRIAKEARAKFQRTYITFVHYETIENYGKKMKEKHGITSILGEAERLKKINPHFCYLVAQNDKHDQILKYTYSRAQDIQKQIKNTKYAQQEKNKSPPQTASLPFLKKSVSKPIAMKPVTKKFPRLDRQDTFFDPVEQDIIKSKNLIIRELTNDELQSVIKFKKYGGRDITTIGCVGTIEAVRKKLYYANRLQMTSNYYMQPIYAYSIMEKEGKQYELLMVTDRTFKKLSEVLQTECITVHKKITILVQVGKIITKMHQRNECYSDLSVETVLIDDQQDVFLSALITKQAPPLTNGLTYDIHLFLMLIYRLFTESDLTHDILLGKLAHKQYFCCFSHRSEDPLIGSFLHEADILFAGETDLPSFLQQVDGLTLA